MITLTDSVTSTSIELYPSWETETPEEKILNSNTSIGNNNYEYQWSIVKSTIIKLENENIDNIKQLNEWWKEGTELFVSDEDFLEISASTKAIIFNAEQPFQSMKKPYNNEADGTINLRYL